MGSPRRPEPPHKHKGRSHAARRLTIIPHPARRRRGASPAIFPDTSTGRLSPRRAPGLSATAFHDSVTLKWDVPNDDSITGYLTQRRNIVEQVSGEFTTVEADMRVL